MKKTNFLLPLVIAAFLTLCFTQCYKERRCGATITCLYQPNDTAPLTLAKGVVISLDTTERYNHIFYYDSIQPSDSIREEYRRPISDSLKKYFPTKPLSNGTYSFILPHPALLVLKAELIDTTTSPSRTFVGHTQITLEEGVLEKPDTIILEQE